MEIWESWKILSPFSSQKKIHFTYIIDHTKGGKSMRYWDWYMDCESSLGPCLEANAQQGLYDQLWNDHGITTLSHCTTLTKFIM